jgi:Spy/CpxP family protein refolding chaperone
MKRVIAWAFAALLLMPMATSAGVLCDKDQGDRKPESKDGKPGQGHQPVKWWVEPKLRAELGITDQQSAAIEAIWSKEYKRRVDTRKRLEDLEKQLDQMMSTVTADEAAIVAQIDKVEAARTEASKMRLLMLYRINKVLTPEQREKVDAKAKQMRDQRPGDRRREQ